VKKSATIKYTVNKKPTSNTIWIQNVSEEADVIGAVVLNVYCENGTPVTSTNNEGVVQVTANIYQGAFAYIDLNTYEALKKLGLVKTAPNSKVYVKLVFDVLNPTVDEFDSWK